MLKLSEYQAMAAYMKKNKINRGTVIGYKKENYLVLGASFTLNALMVQKLTKTLRGYKLQDDTCYLNLRNLQERKLRFKTVHKALLELVPNEPTEFEVIKFLGNLSEKTLYLITLVIDKYAYYAIVPRLYDDIDKMEIILSRADSINSNLTLQGQIDLAFLENIQHLQILNLSDFCSYCDNVKDMGNIEKIGSYDFDTYYIKLCLTRS